jgi:acetyl esterase/lipase
MKRTVMTCVAGLLVLLSSGCQVPDPTRRDVAGAMNVPVSSTIQYRIESWATLEVAHSRGEAQNGTIVWVHGGAWIAGSNSFAEVPGYVIEMLDEGWSIVSVGYPSALNASTSLMIESVQHATTYVRDNGATLGLKSSVVVLGGHSAGGWLAAMAARGLDVDGVLAFSAPLDLAALALNPVPLYGFNLASITNVLLDCAELRATATDQCGVKKLDRWSFTKSVRSLDAPMYLGYGGADTVVTGFDQRAAAARLTAVLGDKRVWVDVAERSGHSAEGMNVRYLAMFLGMVADGLL